MSVFYYSGTVVCQSHKVFIHWHVEHHFHPFDYIITSCKQCISCLFVSFSDQEKMVREKCKYVDTCIEFMMHKSTSWLAFVWNLYKSTYSKMFIGKFRLTEYYIYGNRRVVVCCCCFCFLHAFSFHSQFSPFLFFAFSFLKTISFYKESGHFNDRSFYHLICICTSFSAHINSSSSIFIAIRFTMFVDCMRWQSVYLQCKHCEPLREWNEPKKCRAPFFLLRDNFLSTSNFFFADSTFELLRANEIGLGIQTFKCTESIYNFFVCSHREWMLLICMNTWCGLSTVNTGIYANDATTKTNAFVQKHCGAYLHTSCKWNKKRNNIDVIRHRKFKSNFN